MVVYTLEQRWEVDLRSTYQRCCRLAKCACDRLTEDVDFGKKKIIFSDETHFDLAKYVNKQNCRNCEKPMHPKRVTV